MSKYTIIDCKIPYLYHTTTIYNDKSIQEFKDIKGDRPDFQFPKKDKFSEKLDIKKYFTVTPLCNYASPWMGYDEVFLRYETIKDLKLLDIRGAMLKYHETLLCRRKIPDYPSSSKAVRTICNNIENLDGYISLEDHTEVCLFNASECVDPFYDILEFKNDDHTYEYECSMINYITDD